MRLTTKTTPNNSHKIYLRILEIENLKSSQSVRIAGESLPK